MDGWSLRAREDTDKFPSTESTVIVRGGEPLSTAERDEDPAEDLVERLDDDGSERRDRLERTFASVGTGNGAVLEVVGLVGGVTL